MEKRSKMSDKMVTEQIKFGPRDCLRRLIYKISSQKIVAFVYASGAIVLVLFMAVRNKVMTADVAITAIKAIRDVAITLLGARAIQTLSGYFGKNGKDINGKKSEEPN